LELDVASLVVNIIVLCGWSRHGFLWDDDYENNDDVFGRRLIIIVIIFICESEEGIVSGCGPTAGAGTGDAQEACPFRFNLSHPYGE
jgi:hypothetical protein